MEIASRITLTQWHGAAMQMIQHVFLSPMILDLALDACENRYQKPTLYYHHSLAVMSPIQYIYIKLTYRKEMETTQAKQRIGHCKAVE